MEVFAGFVEHTDTEVGRLIDGIDARGLGDNTLIFYIFGDNGSSAEGQQGSISELLAQNNIANTVEQQMAALERLGGLPVLGGPQTDNMYHAGWAWAGGTPFKGTKLLGGLLRRHPQPDGRRLARPHRTRRRDAPAVRPCRRHRADDLRGARHHRRRRW